MFKYPIVKPFLPDIEKYQKRICESFSRNWLTNQGPFVQELEQRLAEYLGVEHLMLVANGTLALQVAYAALDIQGEVLTTPFSFAATASSLSWQGITPKFVDIDEGSLNVSGLALAKQQLTPETSAILGVHVFGNPCNVESIQAYANEHQLKVVYDAAHAFATKIEKNSAFTSVLNFGDASTLSLHATKLFHSVEGGAIIFKDREVMERAKRMINFGFDGQNFPADIGINAKMSEVHAAMGLTVLENIEQIIQQRSTLAQAYFETLPAELQLQQWPATTPNPGAYQPVIFNDEAQLQFVSDYLISKGIQTRRYFYPSLSQVPAYGMNGETPVADSISRRILCIPMYTELTTDDVKVIVEQLKQALNAYS